MDLAGVQSALVSERLNSASFIHAALVIDPDPLWRQTVVQAIGSTMGAHEYPNWEAAMKDMRSTPANILVVGPHEVLTIRNQVAPLLRSNPNLGILLVMDSLDIEGLRDAMRAGVREVLPASTSPAELALAMQRLTDVVQPIQVVTTPTTRGAINADGLPTRGKLVMVVSAKGGTGVTTVSLNLAAAFAAEGRNVVLCDADPVFGDVALNLGMKAPPPVELGDLPKKLQPEEVAAAMRVHEPSGMKVLDAFRTNMPLHQLPESLVLATLTGLQHAADIAIVDVPAPLVNVAEYLVHADELFFVATTDVASLKNLRVARQLMADAGLPVGKAWLVLNRIRAINDFEASRYEQIVGLPVVAALPDTPAVQQAADAAVPLVLQQPRDPASRAIGKFAQLLGSRFDEISAHGYA